MPLSDTIRDGSSMSVNPEGIEPLSPDEQLAMSQAYTAQYNAGIDEARQRLYGNQGGINENSIHELAGYYAGSQTPSLESFSEIPRGQLPSGVYADKIPYAYPGMDMEDWYAQHQSSMDKFGNGIAGFVGKAVTKTAYTVGGTLGLLGFGNNHRLYGQGFGSWVAGAADNYLAQWGKSAEEAIENKYLPQYQEASDRNQGFWWRAAHDIDLYTHDLTDLAAFVVSNILPAFAVSKLALGTRLLTGASNILKPGQVVDDVLLKSFAGSAPTAGAQAAGAGTAETLRGMSQVVNWATSQGVKNFTDRAAGAIVSTAGEAFWEATDTNRTVMESIENDPVLSRLPLSEKQRIAGTAAKEVMLANSAALFISNLWELKMVLGRLPSVSSPFSKDFVKKSLMSIPERIAKTRADRLLGAAGTLGTGIAVEGFYEENVQLAIQRLAQRRALSDGDRGSYVRELAAQTVGQTVEALQGQDPEASVSIGLGGLVGGGMGLIGNVRDARQSRQTASDLKNYLEKPINAFRGVGNVYKTTTDAAGKEVVEFGPDGQPVYDYDKLDAFMAEQSELLEFQDTAEVLSEDGKKYLHEIYKMEAFSKMAEAHFRVGMGQHLVDALGSATSLSDEDMMAMGYDPKSRAAAIPKIAELQETTRQLQKVYDTIQQNTFAPRGTDPRMYDERKRELFRLSARKMTADKLINTSDAEIARLNDILMRYDLNNNDPTDNLVNEANAKRMAVEAATQHLATVETEEDGKEFSPTPKPRDPRSIEEARERLAQAQEEQAAYEEANKDALGELRTDAQGYYRYKKPGKNALTEFRDLKIEQLKQQELKLSRNSIVQRMGAIAHPTSGQKFFNDFITQINRSGEGYQGTRVGEPLGTKTASDYINYEDRVFRRQNMQSQVDEITRQARGEELSAAIANASLSGIETLVDDALNTDAALPPESLRELRDTVGAELTDRITATQTRVQELSDQSEALTTGDDFDNADPDEQERLIDEAALLQEEADALAQELPALIRLQDKIAQLQAFQPRSITDNQIRRDIAETYVVPADVIIQDMAQSDQGFDTDAELAAVDEALNTIKQLKTIFETRPDNITTQPEFKGFLDGLNSRIDQLQEIRKITQSRISDRKLKDQRVLQSIIRQIATNLGVGTPAETIIADFIKGYASTEYNAQKDELEKLNQDPIANGIKILATYEAMQDLLNRAYKNTDKGNQDLFIEKIRQIQEPIVDEIMETSIVKQASYPKVSGTSVSNYQKAYENNPAKGFSHMLQLGILDKGYKGDDASNSPVNQYIQNQDLNEFLDSAEKDPRTGSKHTQETVVKLLKNHIAYSGLHTMIAKLEGRLPNVSKLETEVAIIKASNGSGAKVVAPSNQQLQVTREFADFYYTNKPNTHYSAFAYLKGYAGTGKSIVVGQWIPKVLALPLDQIFAMGHNPTSSANINNMLGKGEISPTQTDLEQALQTNPNLRLIIIDEVGFYHQDALNSLADAVVQYNNGKPVDQHLKVLLLGDPNQLARDSAGNIQTIPDIESLNMDAPVITDGLITTAGTLMNNITHLTPLTTRFRGNVVPVATFSDKFINQRKDLSKEEIIVQSNNPNLEPGVTQSSELAGVVGTKNFAADVEELLRNTDFDDGKTRAIITSTPEKVAAYTRMWEKIAADRKVGVEKLQVMTYVDAQGQTINEVYVDIEKNPENTGHYNNAMYVALSRATDFLLVGNMNLRNEIDADILSDKRVRDAEVLDSGKVFQDHREEELAQTEAMLGAKLAEIKNEGVSTVPTVTPTGTATPPAQTLAEQESDTLTDAALNAATPTDDNYEGLQTTGSVTDQLKQMSSKPVNTEDEFIHVLDYPTYTATKNLIRIEDPEMNIADREIEVSDAELKIRQETKGHPPITILRASTSADQPVYYVPVSGEKELFFMVMSPVLDGAGQPVPGVYKKIGSLSNAEIAKLNKADSKFLYDQLDAAIKKHADPKVGLDVLGVPRDPQNVQDPGIPSLAVASGFIADIRHMEFEYNPTKYEKFNLNKILNKVFQAYKVVNPDQVRNGAKVVVFTNASKAKHKSTMHLKVGIPYLLLNNMKQAEGVGAPKTVYIRLDRRLLNSKDHLKYTSPILEFIDAARKWNAIVGPEKAYGKAGAYKDPNPAAQGAVRNANVFIHQLAKAELADRKPMVDYYLGRDASTQEVTDLVTHAQTMANNYLIPRLRLKKGDDVRHKTRTFTRVETATTNTLGPKGTRVLVPNRPAKVESVLTWTTDAEGNKTPETVRLMWTKFSETGTEVPEMEVFHVNELDITEQESGPAQRRINQLWQAQIDSILEADLPGRVAMQKSTRGGIVKTGIAPGLLAADNAYGLSLELLENLFTFDTQGNSAPKIPGGFQFRIPVPVEEGHINFTEEATKNSVFDDPTTEFFLQSNFEALSPTVISVKFNKTAAKTAPAKPAPAPPTLAALEPEKPKVVLTYETNVRNIPVAVMRLRKGATIDELTTHDQTLIANFPDEFQAEIAKYPDLVERLRTESKPEPQIEVEDVRGKDRRAILEEAQRVREKFGPASTTYSRPPGPDGIFRSGDFVSDPSHGFYEILISQDRPNEAIFRFSADSDAFLATKENQEAMMGTATTVINPIEPGTEDTIVDATAGYGELKKINGDWTITKKATVLFETEAQPLTPYPQPNGAGEATTQEGETTTEAENEAPTTGAGTNKVPPPPNKFPGFGKIKGPGDPGKKLSGQYGADSLGKAMTKPEVLKTIKRFFPNMSTAELAQKVQFVSDAQMMQLSLGVEAWGLFKNNIIYLRENPDNTVHAKVVRHEVFHMIFDNYLTTEEQEKFRKAVKKEVPQSNYMTETEFNQFVDEYLANAFMEKKPLSSFSYAMRQIIKKIMDFFNFITPNIESISALFAAIDSGIITSRFASQEELIKDFIDDGVKSQTILTNC